VIERIGHVINDPIEHVIERIEIGITDMDIKKHKFENQLFNISTVDMVLAHLTKTNRYFTKHSI